jgi:hypothetical protein
MPTPLLASVYTGLFLAFVGFLYLLVSLGPP